MGQLASELPDDAAAGQTRPVPGSAEAAQIADAFSELLNRDPQAVINSMRDKAGHVVLNADDLFKRWPAYAENPKARRWLGPLLYATARDFIDGAFADMLSKTLASGRNVVFTAGGGASGKSTVLRSQADRPDVDFVVDTTFSSTVPALGQIDAALAAGRFVEVNYVYRDFADAVWSMIRRALDPQVGRIVPIDDLARTHFGSRETVSAVLERYQGHPRVAVLLWQSMPGRVKPLSVSRFAARELPALDELQRQGQAILDESFERSDRDQDGEWQGLSGDRSFYETARSRAQAQLSPSRIFPPERDAESL